MKFAKLLAIASCLLTASALQAQEVNNDVSYSQFKRDFQALSLPVDNYTAALQYNEEKYQKFKRMRTTGIILTAVGASAIVGGIALIASADGDGTWSGNTYYGSDEDAGKIAGGAIAIVLGGLATGGGITLWTIGNNKMKKYSAVNLRQTKNGIGLAYSF